MKPNLKHIRVFGCVAFMKIPHVHVKKLDDRSRMVVYLGKEPGTKASRLYDPVTGTLHISRDVVFQEEKFWPWEQQNTSEVSMPNLVHLGGSMMEEVDADITESEARTPQQYRMSSASVLEPSSATEGSSVSQSSDEESETQRFRLLSDIYNETEEIELEDDMLLVSIEEPTNCNEAAKEEEWRKAMETELDAIEKNNTWVLTDLPEGHKAIGLKWVFKLKKNTNGEVVKHKARLVAKGYVQKQGIDFEEAFAHVTRMETVRLLLALSAKNGWEVHHLDIKCAFLNGEIQEEVYVLQPEGFEKEGQMHKVYRLLKALYGLRQAPRAWYARLKGFLEMLGFTKCPYEHAVYVKREGSESLIVGVYVDDLLVTGTKVENIVEFKK